MFKRWAKFFRFFAFTILIVIVIFWIDQINKKQQASQMYYHQELVTSVTLHVAKLIEKGDYKTADTILNRFNSDYWEYENNNEKLKTFIQSMDIPIYNRVAESLEKFRKNKDNKK